MTLEAGGFRFADDAEDQARMLQDAMAEEAMSESMRRYVLWAGTMATRDEALLAYVSRCYPQVPCNERRDIRFALHRMAVTNPYFFSRNFVELESGGTLEALNMRPFASIDVNDEAGYHYACVAISMINGGFNCLRSHASSLLYMGQSEAALDQAMRISAALNALRQALYTHEHWGSDV